MYVTTRRRFAGIGENHGFSACRDYYFSGHERVPVSYTHLDVYKRQVLAHQVVHEERLAAARRTQYELVAVGGDAPLHRQVGMSRCSGFPVSLSTILMPKGESELR